MKKKMDLPKFARLLTSNRSKRNKQEANRNKGNKN